MKGTWDSGRDPIVALAAGDSSLFEAFVLKETSTFLGFFRRLGVGPSEAEDLVQEVFLKLFRNANTYQPTGRFQAFAFRVARNAWIDRSRRAALRPRNLEGLSKDEDSPAFDAPSDDPRPEVHAQNKEEALRVGEALLQLSEAQRLVFELGVIQELPYGEIASALEIPEGTVKSRMFHAVRNLRQLLEPTPSNEGNQPNLAPSATQQRSTSNE